MVWYVENQCASYKHQAQSRHALQQLWMENIRDENSCIDITALDMIHQCILDVSPSCGADYQADTYRQDFLANAVRSDKSATDILQSRLTWSSDTETFEKKTLYWNITVALTTSSVDQEGETDPLESSVASDFYGSTYARPKHKGENPARPEMNIRSMLRSPNRIK